MVFLIEIWFTCHKVNHFKVYIQCFLLYLQRYTNISMTYFHSIFITPKRQPTPIPISNHSPFSPSSTRRPLIYFLLQLICLFFTFPIDGIIQFVVFCVWLLSLSIVFSRYSHVEACIVLHFFLWLNNTQ